MNPLACHYKPGKASPQKEKDSFRNEDKDSRRVVLIAAPEKAVEVDGVVLVEDDVFLLQALLLNFIARKRLQGNFTLAVDDPVPGQVVGR